jgi:hypothetical protein
LEIGCMDWEMLVSGLFGMTLLAAILFGLWQYSSVRRSREARGESGHVSHPPMQKGPPSDESPLR